LSAQVGTDQQQDGQIEEYNQRFLNADRPVMQRVQEDWVLFNRVMGGELNFRKILTILTFAIGFLYLIMPYDLIPDSLGAILLPLSYFSYGGVGLTRTWLGLSTSFRVGGAA
jgi:hypothetical protein